MSRSGSRNLTKESVLRQMSSANGRVLRVMLGNLFSYIVDFLVIGLENADLANGLLLGRLFGRGPELEGLENSWPCIAAPECRNMAEESPKVGDAFHTRLVFECARTKLLEYFRQDCRNDFEARTLKLGRLIGLTGG